MIVVTADVYIPGTGKAAAAAAVDEGGRGWTRVDEALVARARVCVWREADGYVGRG